METSYQFTIMLAFGFVCWGVGDTFRNIWFPKSASFSELARHTLSFSAGNIFLSYILTAFGFAHLLSTSTTWGIFLCGICVSVWRIFTSKRDPRPCPAALEKIRPAWPFENSGEEQKKATREKRRPIIFMGIITLLFLFPAALKAAAPPHARDALVYHLLCPHEYLKAKGVLFIDGNLYSAFSKGHEMLMTLLLALGGDRAAQGFSVLQHLATVGGVYAIARFITGPWGAVICTIGCTTVPSTIASVGTGYVEPALLMTLVSALLVLVHLFIPRKEKHQTASFQESAFLGFLAGWIPALKYTGLIYLLLIGFLLLWNQRKAPPKPVFLSAVAYALGALPGLCWNAWNWATLGNPVYPIAGSLFGGTGWDDTKARAFRIYFDLFGMGKNFIDYVLLPWRLAFSGQFDSIRFDGALGPFLIVFLTLSLASAFPYFRRSFHHKRPQGIGFAALASAALFVFGTQQARFWLPTQILICVASIPVLDFLFRQARANRSFKFIICLVIGFSLLWNMWFLGQHFLQVASYKPVLGLEEERVFLSRNVPGYAGIEFINTQLPETSRTLCVWTGAYGYYFRKPFYTDTFLEDFTLKRLIDSSADGDDFFRRITESKFSHLFVQLSYLERNMEPRQRKIFYEFLTKRADELFRSKDYAIFAVIGHLYSDEKKAFKNFKSVVKN